MNRFLHFIFYNNTIPIILGVLFLGAGATLAASPEARSAVIDSETQLTSIDNSYLLTTTITEETVGISISSVTENAELYFVEYTMTTIEVRDGVWQPVTKTKVFEVRKDSIVGQDLGLYVEQELAEVHTFATEQLRSVQESERQAGITPKVVATEYSGLVGQFFDPQREEFPRYDPLISPDVGVPLSREQERAHEAVRRLIEEEKNKREQQDQATQPDETSDEGPQIGTDTGTTTGDVGGSVESEENREPAGDLPAEDVPVESPEENEQSEPNQAPAAEPEQETPPTLESIGL